MLSCSRRACMAVILERVRPSRISPMSSASRPSPWNTERTRTRRSRRYCTTPSRMRSKTPSPSGRRFAGASAPPCSTSSMAAQTGSLPNPPFANARSTTSLIFPRLRRPSAWSRPPTSSTTHAQSSLTTGQSARRYGPPFNGGRSGTLWYYRALADAFRTLGPSRLAEELDRVVSELEQLAGPPPPSTHELRPRHG